MSNKRNRKKGSSNTEQPSPTPDAKKKLTDEERRRAMFAWLGWFYLGIGALLILMKNRGKSKFVRTHAIESANMAMSALLVYFPGAFTYFSIRAATPFFAVILAVALFALGLMVPFEAVRGAIAAWRGQEHRVGKPIVRILR